MNLSAGKIIANGQLQIARRLGSGPFDITYLALHLETSRIVVVKEVFVQIVCSRGDEGGVEVVQDSRREYFDRLLDRIESMYHELKDVRSKHVVTIHDTIRSNGTLYVVQDYVAGIDLDQYLRKNILKEEQAIDFASKIGQALRQLHAQGIHHLAIEPRNIRITHDDELVLVGFASGKCPDRCDQTASIPGLKASPYAPLELGNMGATNATPASDVYSLAATLYAMLTRLTPPSANDQLCDGFPQKLLERKRVSQQTIDALRTAMSPSRLSRPQSVDEFLALLGVTIQEDTPEETFVVNDYVVDEALADGNKGSQQTSAEADEQERLNEDIRQVKSITGQQTPHRHRHRATDSRFDTIRQMVADSEAEENTIDKARALYRQCFDTLDQLYQQYGDDHTELQELADDVAHAVLTKLHAPLLTLSLDYEMECEQQARDIYQNACREANLVVLSLTTLPVSQDFIDNRLLPYSTSLKHLSEADLPTSSKPFWKR